MLAVYQSKVFTSSDIFGLRPRMSSKIKTLLLLYGKMTLIIIIKI